MEASAQGEEVVPGSKKRGKEVEEVRHGTVKATARSRKAEEDRGGQIWRETPVADARNPRAWRRHRAHELDSFHRVDEESEADLVVVSDRQGEV